MWDVVSRVGQAAYRTAAMTGLAAGTEQPPYPCALPLKVVDNDSDPACIQGILDSAFSATTDMFENNREHQWELVDYVDPEEGGDLHLFTRPHVGPFNFVKATLSFVGVSPQNVLDTMHGSDVESRKKYSANLSHFEVLANPKQVCAIELHKYWAPPPIAGREFVFLTEKKYVESENMYYVYGCSIDYTPMKETSKGFVRAACLWAWKLMPVGDNTMATYVSCMNPCGWTPTFIFGWLKSEIGKELVACRRVLYGETVNLERTTLQSMGLTDEVNKLTDEERQKMSEE
uniref:START domain-containing protein n=1 Tax=Trypanosoma congolense (strain IL3000) TaxID=1068625 RepID=G0UVR0_TRYCI|nr:conserved hypothetical protein [Trypanosoma congolense IL3000]